MQISTQELQQVAAAGPRFDMYAGIHKAMRALMADTLLAVGRMDVEDALELAQVSQRVLELLEACRSHLQHENDFLHTAIEARAPGTTGRVAGEHAEHEASIERLAGQVARLRAAPEADRAHEAQRLYRALALFMAENLEHMHYEETVHNAALWAHYPDEDLVAIHDALVASIPPQEMMAIARWLVPFMNPQERAMMLQDMRGKAPAPAFQAILDTVQPHLDQREWAKLAAALALPVVPGLATA